VPVHTGTEFAKPGSISTPPEYPNSTYRLPRASTGMPSLHIGMMISSLLSSGLRMNFGVLPFARDNVARARILRDKIDTTTFQATEYHHIVISVFLILIKLPFCQTSYGSAEKRWAPFVEAVRKMLRRRRDPNYSLLNRLSPLVLPLSAAFGLPPGVSAFRPPRLVELLTASAAYIALRFLPRLVTVLA